MGRRRYPNTTSVIEHKPRTAKSSSTRRPPFLLALARFSSVLAVTQRSHCFTGDRLGGEEEIVSVFIFELYGHGCFFLAQPPRPVDFLHRSTAYTVVCGGSRSGRHSRYRGGSDCSGTLVASVKGSSYGHALESDPLSCWMNSMLL
jgi:hypothetical protein